MKEKEIILPGYVRVTDPLEAIAGFENVPDEIMTKAGIRGTRTHHAIDGAIIKGVSYNSDGLDRELTIDGYMKSFDMWYKKQKFIKRPERIYCDEKKLTGLLDGIYEEEDGLVLLDFKTSAKESITWPLQLSAYSYLAEKVWKMRFKRIEIIKLDRYGGSARTFVYQENREMYFKCLDVYNYKNKAVKETYLDYL